MSLMHVWYGRIPGSSWNHVTDEKSVERILTITSPRIERVPIGLSCRKHWRCPYGFITFPFIKLCPNIQFFNFKIPTFPVRASLHGQSDHQSPGDGAVIYTICFSVPSSDQEWPMIKPVSQLKPAEKCVIEIYAY